MCGVSGVVATGGKPISRDVLVAMNDALRHRGPDDEGYFLDPGKVGLAVRRLSIIDVAHGHQPVHNESGSLQVVFNGEIYNHADLRRDLMALGHGFSTRSDSEVIVHLYEEYGLEFLHWLRGMFVFALYDRREDLLVLARDRSGKKPLYYAQTADHLVFASEIKAIHQSGLIDKRLDPAGLDGYLSHGFVPGEGTLFAGVRKLPAGCMLMVKDGRTDLRSYWDLPRRTDPGMNEEEAASRIGQLLKEAVEMRLMSEVPLGVFLSGGLDSSAIVALASRALDRPLKTFSIGFGDPRLDELSHANKVAAHFGCDHREEIVTTPAPDLLEKVNWAHDEPAADPAILPTFLLAEFASTDITVALTGEGGDELFAGYSRYELHRKLLSVERRIGAVDGLARCLSLWPSGLWPARDRRVRKGLWIAGLPRGQRPRGWLTTFPDDEKHALCRPDFRARLLRNGVNGEAFAAVSQEGEGLDDLSRCLYVDSKLQLADQLLMKTDKATMAASIEARCPLLDHKLVEFVATLPIDMKISSLGSKLIFKKAIGDLVPREIVDRPKQGFEVPIDTWLRGPFKTAAEDLLLAPDAGHFDYLDIAFVRGLWADFLRRPDRLLARQLWLLLNLAVWWDSHWPTGSARARAA